LIACCDVAAARLTEMMAEFELSDLEALARHILTTSRRATEAEIARLPRGTYRHRLMTDGYDFEIALETTLTISETGVHTDFTGSSGPSRFGINVPIKYAQAYAVYAMRTLIGQEIPNNAGSLAPFTFSAPEACIVNAQPPAPVAMRHNVGHMVCDLIFGAIERAMPGLAPAEGATCLWDIPLRSAAGAAREGFTEFATELTHAGGMGARPAKDGLSATAFPSGIYGTQTEIAEATAPLQIHARRLIPDSGGAGRHRGGLGQEITLEHREGAGMVLFAGVERVKHAALGREGGGAGALGEIRLSSGEVLPGKGEFEIPGNTRLIWRAPGGGGYGPAHTRDPESVARDVACGLVSPEAAREIYGVALTPEGAVDRAETRKLRARRP
ncbi:MAG: hydantoinase B/oxoprolinase family protein, partial [Pseudomonadota bacterium]